MNARLTPWFTRMIQGLDEVQPEQKKQLIAKAFFLICGANFFSKLADLLASPKITLAWLMQALGAPAFAISLIVPIRESGSMLPQLLIAGRVSAVKQKSSLYKLGAVVQGLSVFGIVLIAYISSGVLAGWLIIAMIILFSLGRCLCSLVSKAVLGKVIPQSLRGQTTGWSATIAGLTSCVFAAFLLTQGTSQSLGMVLLLLILATAAWLLASFVYGFVDEPADTQSDESNSSKPFVTQLELLREDRELALFIAVRALLVSSALIAPYFILLSGSSSSGIRILGGLLLASGLAKLLTSVVWGRWSDQSSRKTLIVSGVLVFLLGGLTTFIHFFSPTLLNTVWLIPLVYFGLEIAHQGVRVARKTYIVDLADDETRVAYVALSNSLIGALLLAAGVALGILSTILPPIWLIAVLSLMSLAGCVLATRLRELQA